MKQQLIRAARNELRGLAALATFVVVTGGTLFLTVGLLGASDRLLWLILSIVVGAVAAWALKTWLLPRLH
jgi:hypothetical protein